MPVFNIPIPEKHRKRGATAWHLVIAAARKNGSEVRIDLDPTEALCSTLALSTKEVGREWVALLNGKPSIFEASVARLKVYAPRRRNIPGWRTTRLRIFERDGYTCTYCGSMEQLECDHIIPLARGGGSNDRNLTTACRDCNFAKRDRTPGEWRS